MAEQRYETGCCIVGGGPAGIMLGYLLARGGVRVTVLEKHADFFRDFRGDTIHPSTLDVMKQLGLLDALLQLPHQETRELGGYIGNIYVPLADMTHLPTACKFLAFMPQWDFLNFLAERAKAYPTFTLLMNAEVTGIIEEAGRVAGVYGKRGGDDFTVRATLTVGADGRNSIVREKAGMQVVDFGAPMDILWFRISRVPSDPHQALGRVQAGKILVMIERGDYWQCGYVIPKGEYEQMRTRDISTLRQPVLDLAPELHDRVNELHSWDDVRLLTVRVDRLEQWYRPGLLFIGDAAHAMSPIGGVGINLAIQDAVAAANILAAPLLSGTLQDEHLKQLQERRLYPTRLIQWGQVQIQRRIISRVLTSTQFGTLPWPMKLLVRFPVLRRLPAYAVGVGPRPERVAAYLLK